MSLIFKFIAETGSTNADLSARLSAGEHIADGYWLIADRQTDGRGRQGREWLDGPGNFMGSTVVELEAQDKNPALLSMVAALALFETVQPRLANPLGLRLKWPNDILLDGAKFSGILLERIGNYVVLGLGVNLASAPELQDRTTKALSQQGPSPARDMFAHELGRMLKFEIARWRDEGGAQVRRRWLAAAHPSGTALSVHDENGQRITGLFDGLEEDGALRLQLADGGCRVIRAGDVVQEDS